MFCVSQVQNEASRKPAEDLQRGKKIRLTQECEKPLKRVVLEITGKWCEKLRRSLAVGLNLNQLS